MSERGSLLTRRSTPVPPPPVATAAAPPGDDAGWQRLAPLSLVTGLLGIGPRLLNLVPALAAIGIVGNWSYVVPALALFVLLSAGALWLRWRRFRYRLANDEVRIESGIFERQARSIPLDRIQDVTIAQGLVARALGLAMVSFETGAAGNNDEDGRLDAILLTEAEALRTAIRAHRTAAAPRALSPDNAPAATVSVAAADRLIFAMPPRRLVIAGLFQFSLAALAVVGAASQWFDGVLPDGWLSIRELRDVASESGMAGWVQAHRWLSIGGGLAVLLLVGFATGVVRMVLTNWGFALTLGPRAFRRVRGLTTRTDVAIPLARVQAVVVGTGLVRRWWGWHDVRVQSLARDNGGEGPGESDHLLVPLGTLADAAAVLAPLRLMLPPADAPWQPSLLAPQLVGPALAALLLAGGGIGAMVAGFWQGGISIAVGGAIVASGWAGAAAHRWWADLEQNCLYVWRGWWRPRLTILPLAHVQSADLAAGPVLRHWRAARLVLGVPGGSYFASHGIDALPEVAAAQLRAHILAAPRARP